MGKKLKNLFNLFDLSVEKLEEVTEKSKLDSMDYVSFDTLFNEKGDFEYALFKYKMGGRVKARMLRLFHIRSVSNQIRTQINNEEAFRNILNKFGKEHISFTSLYSYKPGKNLIIAYGVLVDGYESDLKRMEKETALYINSLEDKFRAAYNNVEIEPLTTKEEWLFEGFHYEHLSVMRGVPKPDPNVGAKVGSSPYSSPPRMGRQVSEILLKGMTANRQGKVAQGHPFLMYTVFDRLTYDEIERALHQVQDTLSKLWSSRQYSMSESENFSLPILFAFGMGEMVGQSHGTSVGHGNAHAVSDASGESHSVGKSTGFSNGNSSTDTDATSSSSAKANTHSKTGNGGVGINFGISDSFGWSEGDSHAKTHTSGESESHASGMSQSTTYGNSNSDGSSNTHSVSNTQSTSASETQGTSQSQNKSANVSGGASSGDGSGVSRQQINHFFDFAIEMFTINEMRFKHSLRDGMYDYRTFLLTKEEQGKVTAEELIKQSYMDNHSPFPIRVLDIEKDEEKNLKKYARMMAKPLAPEPKPVLPERWKYSTYITPMEASAFNLPQENLVGYLSSFDPVPPSISYIGEMEDGAEIGYQINPALNLVSPMPFNVVKEKLSHIGIFGATGVGKTVFTQKYVSSVHNRYNINFMLFDWTRNHRSLIGHLKDPKKFRFNSFDTDLYPLKINLIVPPRGVKYHLWNSVVSELMCHSMGLGDRSFRIITKVLRKTQIKAQERGYIPNMEHFATEIEAEYSRRMRDYEARGVKFMPSNEQQTFGSMTERLEEWLDKEHPVYKVMCEGPFMEIEDLVAGDFVHLIECMELPLEIRQFVINGIAAGVFYYCKSRSIKLKNPTYLMFEEAHTVLKEPQGKEPLNVAETIFETINREARNFNLYIGYICQSPEKLPPLIFDNLPLRVVFQLPDDEGKKKIISAGGKDPIRLDIDLVKWLSNQPMGTCLIRNSKFTRLQDAEFAAVKVSMLPTDELDDKMFKTLYQKTRLKQSVK